MCLSLLPSLISLSNAGGKDGSYNNSDATNAIISVDDPFEFGFSDDESDDDEYDESDDDEIEIDAVALEEGKTH